MSSSSSSSAGTSSPQPPSKRTREEKDDEESAASDSSSSSSESEPEDNDVPALSHAEKRRQKKKKEKQNAPEPPTKKRKLENGKSVSDTPRQNSVWVGNLSFKTTPEALRNFFDGVGEITRVNMPLKVASKPNMPRENLGFAYVDFATADAKTVAITLSEKPLTGRKLLIKDGDDFKGRPVAPTVATSSGGNSYSKTALKILRAQKKPPAPTLFLGNLPFETTEADIQQLFDAHKPKPRKDTKDEEKVKEAEGDKEQTQQGSWIKKIRMGTFEDSGLCKGFAFVDFSNTDHATSTLINPKNHHLKGRNLVVEYASADAVKRGPNKPKPVEGDDASRDARGKQFGRPDNTFSKPRREHPAAAGESKDFSNSHQQRSGPRPTHAGDGNEEEPAMGRDEHASNDRRRFGDSGPRYKGSRNRPKPGAALAQAKRQSAAIVPTSAKKIVF